MIWLFMFCILEGGVCHPKTEIKTDYNACISAQLQYIKDHQGEDYWVVCKPAKVLRT